MSPGWHTTPDRPATRMRCCGMRPRRRGWRQRAARTGRPLSTTGPGWATPTTFPRWGGGGGWGGIPRRRACRGPGEGGGGPAGRRGGAGERGGESLRWRSRLCWWTGQRGEAEAAAARAIAVLETVPPGRQLAMAYSNRSQLEMVAHRAEAAVAWGTRALELARRLGDTETL